MNKSTLVLAAVILLGSGLLFDACNNKAPVTEETELPPTTNGLPRDVLNSCTVSPSDFDTWFVSGKASENGVVQAANSVTFPHNDNCDFYQWSHHMFLWVTSTLPSEGVTVMESPLFYTVTPEDASGKRHLIPNKVGTPLRVNSTITQKGPRGKRLVINALGEIVDSEENQATGDGLLTQTGSLVYYITLVNDVYAFYLEGAKAGKLNANQFPTTAGARDSICSYARSKGVALPDSNALAMELKTSWVEVNNLPNASNYVTINAVIPTYDKSNPNKWIPTGDTTARLALIGIHVVGSVAGHPEMVWSTFEHNKNTPNAEYSYVTNQNTVKTVPPDGGTGWLLTNDPSDANPNQSHIKVNGDTLVNAPNFSISAGNTQRTKPWGVLPGLVPNQQDTSASASNSEVISINNAVNSLLVGNDVRKNYNQLGATWTFGGNPPNGKIYPEDKTSGQASIGTSALANSTMETYFQSGQFINTSCFSCHHGGSPPSLNPNVLSHVFKGIQVPIPPPLVK